MWIAIAFLILALVAAFIFYMKKNKPKMPSEHYVCDICGEHDCLCRKKDEPA